MSSNPHVRLQKIIEDIRIRDYERCSFDNETKAIIAQQGGIPVLLGALSSATNASDVRHCCRLLKEISQQNDTNVSRIINENGVGLVIRALDSHIGHSGVAEEAINVLLNLISAEEGRRKVLAGAAGIPVILSVLDQHRTHPGIQSATLRLIIWLARSGGAESQRKLCSLGAIDALLKGAAMGVYASIPGLQEKLVFALTSVGKFDEYETLLGFEAAAVEISACLNRQHKDAVDGGLISAGVGGLGLTTGTLDATLEHECMTVLQRLATTWLPTRWDRLVQHKGLLASIIGPMLSSPTDEELQLSCATTLRELASRDVSVRAPIIAKGAMRALISGMVTYKTSPEMLGNFVATITALIAAPGTPDDAAHLGRMSLLAETGVPTLLSTIGAFVGRAGYHQLVLRPAAEVLRVACASEDVARQVVSVGGLPLILEALKANTVDEDLQVSLVHLLECVAPTPEFLTWVQSNSLSALMQTLRFYPRCYDLQLAGCRVLGLLFQRPVAVPKVLDMGIKLMLSALAAHPRKVALLEACCNAFAIRDARIVYRFMQEDGVSYLSDVLKDICATQPEEIDKEFQNLRVEICGFVLQVYGELSDQRVNHELITKKSSVYDDILMLMRVCLDDLTVQFACLRIIGNLVGNVDVARELCQKPVNSQKLFMCQLADTTGRHEAASTIVVLAAWITDTLGDSETMRRLAVSSGLIHKLLAGMRYHTGDLNIQKHCAEMLLSFSEDPTTAPTIVEAGTINLLIIAMQHHRGDSELCEYVLQNMSALCQSFSADILAVKLGGYCCDAMVKHSDNEHVLLEGLFTLERLVAASGSWPKATEGVTNELSTAAVPALLAVLTRYFADEAIAATCCLGLRTLSADPWNRHRLSTSPAFSLFCRVVETHPILADAVIGVFVNSTSGATLTRDGWVNTGQSTASSVHRLVESGAVGLCVEILTAYAESKAYIEALNEYQRAVQSAPDKADTLKAPAEPSALSRSVSLVTLALTLQLLYQITERGDSSPHRDLVVSGCGRQILLILRNEESLDLENITPASFSVATFGSLLIGTLMRQGSSRKVLASAELQQDLVSLFQHFLALLPSADGVTPLPPAEVPLVYPIAVSCVPLLCAVGLWCAGLVKHGLSGMLKDMRLLNAFDALVYASEADVLTCAALNSTAGADSIPGAMLNPSQQEFCARSIALLGPSDKVYAADLLDEDTPTENFGRPAIFSIKSTSKLHAVRGTGAAEPESHTARPSRAQSPALPDGPYVSHTMPITPSASITKPGAVLPTESILPVVRTRRAYELELMQREQAAARREQQIAEWNAEMVATEKDVALRQRRLADAEKREAEMALKTELDRAEIQRQQESMQAAERRAALTWREPEPLLNHVGTCTEIQTDDTDDLEVLRHRLEEKEMEVRTRMQECARRELEMEEWDLEMAETERLFAQQKEWLDQRAREWQDSLPELERKRTLLLQARMQEVQRRELDIEEAQEIIGKRDAELIRRAGELENRAAALELDLREMDSRRQGLERREREITHADEGAKVLLLELDERSKELDARELEIAEREIDMERREEELENEGKLSVQRNRELELRGHELDLRSKDIDARSGRLEAQWQDLLRLQTEVERAKNALDMREKDISEAQRAALTSLSDANSRREALSAAEDAQRERERILNVRLAEVVAHETESRDRRAAVEKAENVLREAEKALHSRAAAQTVAETSHQLRIRAIDERDKDLQSTRESMTAMLARREEAILRRERELGLVWDETRRVFVTVGPPEVYNQQQTSQSPATNLPGYIPPEPSPRAPNVPAPGKAGKDRKRSDKVKAGVSGSNTKGSVAQTYGVPWDDRFYVADKDVGGRHRERDVENPQDAETIAGVIALTGKVSAAARFFKAACARLVAFNPHVPTPHREAQLSLFASHEQTAVERCILREKDLKKVLELFVSRRAGCPLSNIHQFKDDTEALLATKKWWREVCRTSDRLALKYLRERFANLSAALHVLLAKKSTIPELSFLSAHIRVEGTDLAVAPDTPDDGHH